MGNSQIAAIIASVIVIVPHGVALIAGWLTSKPSIWGHALVLAAISIALTPLLKSWLLPNLPWPVSTELLTEAGLMFGGLIIVFFFNVALLAWAERSLNRFVRYTVPTTVHITGSFVFAGVIFVIIFSKGV